MTDDPATVPEAHLSVAGVSQALTALRRDVDGLLRDRDEQAYQDWLSRRWRRRG